MAVLNKIKLLSSLSESLRERIKDVRDDANRQLQLELGDEQYSTYIALPIDHERLLPNGEVDPLYVEYSGLTNSAKMRRNIETAEAYLCLYHFVPILKKLNQDTVLISKEIVGTGSSNISEIDEIIKLRNIYLTKARELINMYSPSGGISLIVI